MKAGVNVDCNPVLIVAAVPMMLAAVVAAAGPASSERPNLIAGCAGFSADHDVHESCQRAAQQETELRQSLEHVLPSLAPDDRKALSEDQVEWEGDLADNCLWFHDNTRTEEEPFPKTREDFECLTDRLSLRARILRAMAPEADTSTLEGEYTTRMGAGWLRIYEQVGRKASFEIWVMMGSSTGGIEEGVMTIADDGQTATFTDPEDSRCRLRFTLESRALEVDEDDCGAWRGAGASFDGTYYRMAPDPNAK